MALNQNKKGDLTWEYIALIVLGLLLLVIILVFSGTLREKMTEGVNYFFTTLFGR